MSADRTGFGIAIILASVLAMALADALVKLVSAELSVWQVFATRSLVALPVVFVIARTMRVGLLPRAPAWALLRSALLVLTWLAFYASLPFLELSVAAVAAYTNPIFTALLSAYLLGERVTARQWGGVFVGFLGVLAVLQPGTDAFSWFTLLPLLAAVFYSMAMVLTRSHCREESPVTLVLMLHALFFLTGATAVVVLSAANLDAGAVETYPFLLGDWAPMDAGAWGLMVLLGLLSVAYFVGVARAYQVAPPAIIGTFDYAYLVWAALWGFVLFGERPGPATIAGMALITAAGLLVATPARE